MALRLSSEILHGEIDNRQPGRTTGLLHILGREEPITLDLAGHTLHRLKTARRCVRDAQLAIDTAAADQHPDIEDENENPRG